MKEMVYKVKDFSKSGSGKLKYKQRYINKHDKTQKT